ncbi:MAG: SCO family protein [Dehalococcoidia bacterium]
MLHRLRASRAAGLLAGALLLGALATGCSRAPEFASAVVEPPKPVPGFELVAEGGKPFRLADLKGQVVVLYAGYTHCPDVCPLTLGHLTVARGLLPADVRDEVRVVMITVDPDRDTPELINQYVHYFDPTFIGVSGSTDEVLAALHEWGVHPECSTPDANGAYTVSHPATTFVLNRDGMLRLQMSHTLPPEDMARDLAQVAKEGTRS